MSAVSFGSRAARWRAGTLACGLVYAGLVASSWLNAADPSADGPTGAAGAASPSASQPTESAPAESAAPKETAKPARTAKGQTPSYGIPQVQYINEMIRAGWVDHKMTPSGLATDNEWCRRVYLDVIGRVPTVDEVNKFAADRSANKKANLVTRLLSDEYLEEYSRNWTTIWTNLLIGRTGGTEDDSPTNRDGMQQYLRRCFQRNKTYDQMVMELVSATGRTKPGEEGFNGAANFMVGNLAEGATLATAKTAKIFLGMQVQCTQCHNHPFNEWKQNQFWELNAFFRQTRNMNRGMNRELGNAELVNEDFPGEGGGDPRDAVIFYPLRNEVLKSAYPVFVDGTTLETMYPGKGNSGYLNEMDRRAELGKLIVKSEFMSKAIVNRMWGHFLGYGFTKPVDDMGPHNPPTHPELLDRLAEDFGKHSYDLKQLIRWVVLSEPYALSSRFTKANKADDPSLGEKPVFSHFYVRQMRPEELYESLMTATKAADARGSYEQQEMAKREWLTQIVSAFGNDEGEEQTTFNGTITQTLMMFNGDLMKRATMIETGSFLERVAKSSMNGNAKIQYLYMAALARRPTRDETSLANELVALRKGDGVGAMQDIWWVLLNSNEFILQH